MCPVFSTIIMSYTVHCPLSSDYNRHIPEGCVFGCFVNQFHTDLVSFPLTVFYFFIFINHICQAFVWFMTGPLHYNITNRKSQQKLFSLYSHSPCVSRHDQSIFLRRTKIKNAMYFEQICRLSTFYLLIFIFIIYRTTGVYSN